EAGGRGRTILPDGPCGFRHAGAVPPSPSRQDLVDPSTDAAEVRPSMNVMGRGIHAAAAHDVCPDRADVQVGKRRNDSAWSKGPSPALPADLQGRFEDTFLDRHAINIH